MHKLSTGDDATLGNYLKMTRLVWGDDSKQVEFLTEKIDKSPHGKDEEVLADESQMLVLLASL